MAEEGASEVTGPVRRVLLISAGASHSVALLSGNVVCSWGRGEDGQLGHGDAEDRFVPIQLSSLDDHEVVSITCGADHTIAYSQSRLEVYSWGWALKVYSGGSLWVLGWASGPIHGHRGDFGRLGHGNSSDLFTPQPIKALHGLRIKQIACGDSHCLAVTMEGEVQSWGRNQNGQLGLGTTEDSLVPQKIQAFQGVSIRMVAAGAEHTAAVTEDGELYGWGWGRYGNLGLGDRNDRLVPEKVSAVDGQKMVKVACGWRHTISVSLPGGLYTYGWSKYGQLGHGDFEDRLVPHRLEALRDTCISQISGGWRHTMALSSDGNLYGWGWNKFGQVGVGDGVDHCSPVQVKFPDEQALSYYHSSQKWSIGPSIDFQFHQICSDSCLCAPSQHQKKEKVIQISCGWRHTLAVTERQNVFSWGRGTNGQLGHGVYVDRKRMQGMVSKGEQQTPKLQEGSTDGSPRCTQPKDVKNRFFPYGNVPKIIEALSVDGSSGQQIKSSKDIPSSGKTWVSPSERYAVVPGETVQGQLAVPIKGNGSDASVPESDVKRIRV
ncbi:Ultraviolet-B receptor UVR8 [Morella rubra]|uniref:Ultraviolet-B receptor UVR8 n=1 Tax=Morella rubra TaxID=262757 RepID=A0A6A1VDC0_9ROSI|nr:Ultraviolet-B receptor UVR8 [Morella rubra]